MRSVFRISACSVVVAVASLAALQFFVSREGDGPERVVAGSGVSLSLDLDTSDGVCADIDTSANVPIGGFRQVGVCLDNPGAMPVAAFSYQVLYYDTVVAAPEVADVAPAVDDNPDANVGSTSFSSPDLGGGWSCDGEGFAYPKGDLDGTQDIDGTAFSGNCGSPTGPYTLVSGPLGVITFEGLLPNGYTDLTFSQAVVTGDDLNEIGSCAPAVDVPMNCAGGILFVENPDCANPPGLDDEFRPNGPNVPDNDDATWPRSEGASTGCDLDDDNDSLNDHYEDAGVTQCGYRTLSYDFDSDGDHLHDGWECTHGSDARDPLSKFLGSGTADGDGDRVPDVWEARGYDGNVNNTDSDADGCHDLVEIASVDGNRAIGDPDRLSVARRALNIWGPDPDQDWVLDIDANGVVGDSDRLFVARAALLPDWLPKSCP